MTLDKALKKKLPGAPGWFSWLSVQLFFFFFLIKVYLFILREEVGGRGRERETESQAGSTLSAKRQGLRPGNCKIMI